MRELKKAYLEITNVCNLSCSFCPGTGRKAGFLAPEDFRTLAGRLRPHTEYLYLHLMGEPMLHPQLGQLLDIAGELGFRVMITTNGTLLPRRGGLLLASPAVEKVSISLHSFEGNEELWRTTCPAACHSPERRARRGRSAPCAYGIWMERTPGGPTAGTGRSWGR